MRIARIAMPGALYGASAVAKTFGDVKRSGENPGVFDEVCDTSITSEAGNIKFARVGGFSEFMEKKLNDVNRVNLLYQIKKAIRPVISNCEIYAIWEKRLGG